MDKAQHIKKLYAISEAIDCPKNKTYTNWKWIIPLFLVGLGTMAWGLYLAHNWQSIIKQVPGLFIW